MDRLDATAPLAGVMRRRFVAAAPEDCVRDAEVLMRMGRFRALPVVADDRLEGMLSYRSMVRALLAHDGGAPGALERYLRDTPVAMLMEGTPEHVSPEASLAEVAACLVRSELGCLPVVERDGRLLGIVTEADLLRRRLAGGVEDRR